MDAVAHRFVDLDGYMPEELGRAYLRDLPNAELHITDGGHWLLESHFDTVLPLIRDFVGRVHAPASVVSA